MTVIETINAAEYQVIGGNRNLRLFLPKQSVSLRYLFNHNKNYN